MICVLMNRLLLNLNLVEKKYSLLSYIELLLLTEFQIFLSNFEQLYSKIKIGNPFAVFFTGDFNAHSQLWWPDGDSTPEGTNIEELFSKLGLSQLISEPTNFEPQETLVH